MKHKVASKATMAHQQMVEVTTSNFSLGANKSLSGWKCDPFFPGSLHACSFTHNNYMLINKLLIKFMWKGWSRSLKFRDGRVRPDTIIRSDLNLKLLKEIRTWQEPNWFGSEVNTIWSFSVGTYYFSILTEFKLFSRQTRNWPVY